MLFVYPAFLFGLLSLAVPLVIHLFHFRQYKKVYFSNVQFLKNIQQQESSGKNLKRRAVMIARMLALTFLVLAFSRPFIPANKKADIGKIHFVSVFIDNSYSMQIANKDGSLLEQARRNAKEIVQAYGINDRFQLLTQDFDGRDQRFVSQDEFDDVVDKIKVSPQSRNLQQVIARQQSLLSSQVGDQSLYILSDFQKSMFSRKTVVLDSSMQINLVKFKAASFPNVAVDSVWLLNAIHRTGDTEKLVVKLHNYTEQIADGIPLKLLINGIQKGSASVTLKGRSEKNDTLSFSGLQAGWQQAQIQLQDNPINFDNNFYFAFRVSAQMPVLLLNGGTPNKYLQAVFNTDAFFTSSNVRDGNVAYNTLASYPLVVLSDVKTVSAGLSQQLKLYVNNGGSLIVFPADGADVTSYKLLLDGMQADFPTKVLTEKTKVDELNTQSRLFKGVFEQSPQKTDLPVAERFYELSSSYRKSRENLMTLANDKTFIARFGFGKGKVYVSAVPLDDSYSNLPHHALFVPLMLRIALSSGHDPALFYTIGLDQAVETLPVQLSEKQILKLHFNQQTIIPDVRQQDGVSLLYVSDQVRQPGNYILTRQDSLAAVVAFNNNRSESDLSYMDDADLKNRFKNIDLNISTVTDKPYKDTLAKANIGLELWKLCIILALICLAAETLVIKFYKPDQDTVPVTA